MTHIASLSLSLVIATTGRCKSDASVAQVIEFIIVLLKSSSLIAMSIAHIHFVIAQYNEAMNERNNAKKHKLDIHTETMKAEHAAFQLSR